jgi:hypothetical protein
MYCLKTGQEPIYIFELYKRSVVNTIKSARGISIHLLQVKNEDLGIAVPVVLDLDLLALGRGRERAISLAELESAVELDLRTTRLLVVVSTSIVSTSSQITKARALTPNSGYNV